MNDRKKSVPDRAEAGSRDKRRRTPGILRELFLGSLRLDLLHPFPEMRESPEFAGFYRRMEEFLRTKVDPVRIDVTGEYPPEVIDGLRRLGAFGMKIPKEYGGLGLSQAEYDKVMKLLGGYCGNVTAVVTAHQSIGVPMPLKLFGTEEQKRKYLPRLAAGEISCFALTEPTVGSDPSSMETVAQRTPEGDAYIINGRKLWITNGTHADLHLVMARHPDTRKISAFIVETAWEGVTVEHRCRFMGLRSISNGLLRYTNVRVPRENLVGEEGMGLKIALVTLNTGRLAIPAGCCGAVKVCLEVCRQWAGERVQWGRPIGKHEAIAHKLSDMAANGFAMEAVTDLASRLHDREGYDIRLEAAAAKEWCSFRGWKIIDDAMQICGGRGYETESSLRERGARPIPIERAMRDFRINRIFEGSSEIMHLFIAREVMQKHLGVAAALVDPKADTGARLRAIPKVLGYYSVWYLSRCLSWGWWPRYSRFGRLAGHLRFVQRSCRRLARNTLHGLARFRAALQRKQAYLFRLVDIGLDLFAMAATITRVQSMRAAGHPDAGHAGELADIFCRTARRRIRDAFRDLRSNDDAHKYRIARGVLDGRYRFAEEGVISFFSTIGVEEKEA